MTLTCYLCGTRFDAGKLINTLHLRPGPCGSITTSRQALCRVKRSRIGNPPFGATGSFFLRARR